MVPLRCRVMPSKGSNPRSSDAPSSITATAVLPAGVPGERVESCARRRYTASKEKG